MNNYHLLNNIEKESSLLKYVNTEASIIFPMIDNGKPIFLTNHKNHKLFEQISEYSSLSSFELIPLFSFFEDKTIYLQYEDSRPASYNGVLYNNDIDHYYPICPSFEAHKKELIQHIYEYVSTFECNSLYFKHFYYPFWPFIHREQGKIEKPVSCFCPRCQELYSQAQKRNASRFSNWLSFREDTIFTLFNQIERFTGRVAKKIRFFWEIIPPNWNFSFNDLYILWGLNIQLLKNDSICFVVNFNNPFFQYELNQIHSILDFLYETEMSGRYLISIPEEIKDYFTHHERIINYPSIAQLVDLS